MSPVSKLEMSSSRVFQTRRGRRIDDIGDHGQARTFARGRVAGPGAGRVDVDGAAALMGVTRRQVFRLRKAFLADGPAGLASRRRGKPGNRRVPDPIRQQALAIIRERYADFGPTLAEQHGLPFSREAVRLWMVAEGLWRDRKARHQAVRQPRRRRDCVGELVQIDGSEHGWFEGRGPQCTLLVFVDDATSRLMGLRFVETDRSSPIPPRPEARQ